MSDTVRKGEAGITLIETLAVLAVIGVAAGAMMMTVGDRGRSAEAEALRLARHLTLAVDEALIAGLPLSLQWDSSGYGFGQLSPDQSQIKPEAWPAALLPVLAQRHELAPPLELRQRDSTDERPVILPVSGATPTVTFEITGTEPAWTVSFDGFRAVALPEARF